MLLLLSAKIIENWNGTKSKIVSPALVDRRSRYLAKEKQNSVNLLKMVGWSRMLLPAAQFAKNGAVVLTPSTRTGKNQWHSTQDLSTELPLRNQ